METFRSYLVAFSSLSTIDTLHYACTAIKLYRGAYISCENISQICVATIIRSMNHKDVPFHLADKMKASSLRRFETKNEAEVDETATKWKKSGSTITAYMEQKLDKQAKNIFIQCCCKP